MDAVKDFVGVLLQNSGVSQIVSDRVYPFGSAVSNVPCIVYTPVPLTDDKIKQTWRIEVTAIAEQLSTAYALDTACRAALLTLGDEARSSHLLQIEVNGGAALFNQGTNTHHLTAYYYVTAK